MSKTNQMSKPRHLRKKCRIREVTQSRVLCGMQLSRWLFVFGDHGNLQLQHVQGQVSDGFVRKIMIYRNTHLLFWRSEADGVIPGLLDYFPPDVGFPSACGV